MARMLSTAFCVALLAATAVAFALTEGAKTERSPIFATRIAKVFSPVCNPALCHSDAANIDFRLRARERLEAWMLRNGKRVSTVVAGKTFPKGRVKLAFSGLADDGVSILQTDARAINWLLDRGRSTSRSHTLRIRAPRKPGIYTLYVTAAGHAARATIVVSHRKGMAG